MFWNLSRPKSTRQPLAQKSRFAAKPAVEALEVREVLSTFYVSPTGNDGNAGTSPAAAWQSINKVDSINFSAGDQVLFQGGQKFNGTLQFNSSDGGNATNLLVVGSYGTGNASINGGNGDAVDVSGSTGVQIQNLNLLGAGYKTGNTGVGIKISNAHSVTALQLDVTGFEHAGVEVNGGSNVNVSHVNAHSDGGFGIHVQGGAKNIYIGYSNADDNPNDPGWTHPTYNYTGSGIYVESTSGATVEYCEASNNGYEGIRQGGGPVGIWAANADHITVQYCISHDNKTTAGDGDAFDFDGDTSYSVLQYCLAYHNVGSAIGPGQYGGAPGPNHDNTYRYNIAIDNAQGVGSPHGELATWSYSGDGAHDGLYNQYFYNNLLLENTTPIRFWSDAPNVFLLNNIFLSRDGTFVDSYNNDAKFAGNAYWGLNNGSFSVDGYGSLGVWSAATGQESVGGKLVGLNVDPGIDMTNLMALTSVTDPTKLAQLTSYLLAGTSPLVDHGVDIKALYGIDPGNHDFYGKPAPYGNGFDIGPSEFQGRSPATPTGLTSAPGYGQVTLTWDAVADATSYMLFRSTNSGGEGGTPYKTGLTGTTFTDTGLINGTTYFYQISARNTVGQSDYSPEVSATLQAPVVRNLFSNDGFENGTTGGWSFFGATVVANNAHGGTHAAQLTGVNSGVAQTFTGLSPNTIYTFTGWGKAATAGSDAYLYVQNADGSYSTASFNGTNYNQATLTFTTSAGQTSVNIGVWKTTTGTAYVDDLVLVPGVIRNLFANAGFENGTTGGWSFFNALVLANNVHGGTSAAQLTGANSGVAQTITGLTPNTTYIFTGWGKSAAGSHAYLYVQNADGSYSTANFSGTSYNQASLTFTTAANQTSANIGVWKATSGIAYVDDLALTLQIV